MPGTTSSIHLALTELDLSIQFCRVSDGEEGIWLLEKTHGYENAPTPDLVVLDLHLLRKMNSRS